MKRIKARYNFGRWIWDCPICRAGNVIRPINKMAFCGDCYEDKAARKQSVLNGIIIEGIDKSKQDNAKRKAWAENRVYKISFPRNHKAIIKVLRPRKTEHQCWEVGESIEDLENENKNHKDLFYLVFDEIKIEELEQIETIDLPELDDATLRRIV